MTTHLRRAALLLSIFLLLIPAGSRADDGETISNGTAALPEGLEDFAWRLTDGDENSRVHIPAEETLTLRPEDKAAALLLVWYTPPKSVSVTQLTASGDAIETVTTGGALETLVPLNAHTAELRLTSEEGFALSEYRFLTAEEAENATVWEEPAPVDVMLIAAHAGDELTCFSGLLPTLAERQLRVVTVLLSDQNRKAEQESLRTAAAFNSRIAPVFYCGKNVHLPEEYANEARRVWKDEAVRSFLVKVLRQYRPAVVITHGTDIDGEGGDAMRVYTAGIVQQAVDWAANPARESGRRNALAAHTVQKLYLRMDGGSAETAAADGAQQPTVRLTYDMPLQLFEERTALECAEKALAACSTIALYRPHAPQENAFTLAFSAVGEDSGKNDLFEHIPAETLSNAGLPAPTIAPTPIPTPEPTALPDTVTAPDAAAAAETSDEPQHPGLYPAVGCLALGIATAAALYFCKRRAGTEQHGTTGTLLRSAIPLAAGALLAAALLLTDLPAKTAEPEATPAPTPAATAEPTPEPEPEPEDAWTPYFRQPGDPEEVVLVDEENGRWEYRSDTLSVLIDRHTDESVPLVWYIAHIRMRGVDAFRPGFGSPVDNGKHRLKPWRLARRACAVLAITGDNLVNGEMNRKGRLIRNGRLYADGNDQPTLALCPDMTLRIYERNTPPDTILEDGVQNTFGFGPVLVRDGQVAEEECCRHRVRNKNPRAGIGMVEPGHYVAIVVDGRQAEYSVGVTLLDYAEMFVNEGCTVAYNMDGGVSSGMLFMGENLNQHKDSRSKKRSGQRSWADALLFGYSELVPTEDDPIYNTGNLDEKKPRE